MSFEFGAPALLGGMALIGVPILIHLLNRRRYTVQRFAAMAFLQKAFAKRRRKLRMESLLLLLLRCLAVMLAALAMALPFVPTDSLLAALGGGTRDLVLIMDRSGSMARRLPGGNSMGQRAVEAVRSVVSRLSDEAGDTVTLITMGGGDPLPVPIGARPSALLEALDAGLPAPAGRADMVEAARLLRDRVRAVRKGRLDVEVLTDLQALSWTEDVGPILAEVFDDGGGTLRIEDLGRQLAGTENRGVQSLEAADPLLLAGRSSSFSATLVNHGDTVLRGVRGRFLLDGELRRQFTDIEIPARGSVSVELRLRVDAPGPHHLVFALDPDELPFDDTRTLAFEVRESIEVLIVDGDRAVDPLEGSGGYLALALEPALAGDDAANPVGFATQVVDPRGFEAMGRSIESADLIVLANVGGLGAEALTRLDEVVRSGTSLMIFLGDRVEPVAFGERFGALSPAVVGALRGDPSGRGDEDYVSLVLPEPAPSELALFADPRLAMLLQVPVLAWHELAPVEGAQVLASFVDALGRTTPAIVRARHGLGSTLIVGTTANDAWSLLPRQPATWVPLVHELVSALTRVDPAATNVPVGSAPSLVLQGTPASARLLDPAGGVERIDRPEVERLGNRSRLDLGTTPLDEAGAWSLEIEPVDASRPGEVIALAALPDAREGDLRRIDAATLEQRLTPVSFVMGERLEEDPDDAGSESGDGSLFRFLLWSLLVCLIGESLLARKMGGVR